ncbi:SusC/RagA family TonB-linked outer membrane protein [Longimicrobium sp.]|uniref:SusC/RagA family TonB-linked outer membrane protein n=1 Tax=Longimicrobium sp. TaxID=2029185 RepID=UPI002E32CD9F|nr:SusC/RagA family TonB-linked outer membrane protein [Longimicrobium sp.]HEX6040244.1 SusC/RagA family TonB-linked outer membrane protein [Longimicrobium sp.]
MRRFRPLLAAAALVFAPAALSAQGPATVQGRASNPQGQPEAGVLVRIESLNVGATTGPDGRYTITIPAARVGTGQTAQISASRVGLSTVTRSVSLRPGATLTEDFQMAPNTLLLEGVVVTALGLERQERELGVSTTQLAGEDLSRVETNVVNALSGKVPGVNITNSGPQGGSSRIVIRGENSITGNNQPLFIVDGVPVDNYSTGGNLNTGQGGFDYGNALQDLNPENIASVTVLKGPNAAALYGSRASNGVVIITTKNGSTAGGRPEITVSQNVTWEDELRLPQYQNAYGQGMAGQFSFFDGYDNGLNDGADVSWGPPLDAGLMIPQYNSPIVNGVRQPTPWVSHPDNVDQFFDVGRTLNTSVSVAAGSERMNGRFGFSRMDQDGMAPGFGQEATTLSFSGGLDLTDRLDVNSSVQFVQREGHNRPGVGYGEDNPMSQFVWFGRQVDVKDLERNWNQPRGSEEPGSIAGLPYSWNYSYHPNPYFLQLANRNTDDRNRLIGQISASYEFRPWLRGLVRTGTDWYQDSRQKTYAAEGNAASGLYTTNPLTLNREYVGQNGAFANWDIGFQETNTDFLLTANPEMDGAFSASATFGGNRRDVNRTLDYTWVGDLAAPGIFDVSNAAITPDPYSYDSRKRVNSLYGQADLGYNDYLFLTLTGRNDWSSTLPESNRSYFYPSVSGSFVFSDALPALQNSSWLNYGKLRASWAQVGNDTDPYQLVNTYLADEIFNGLPTFSIPGALRNSSLRPEITESVEMGAELGFFDNRLGLDVTVYDSRTRDQIMPVEISRATGYTSRFINAGTVRNRGVEVLLRGEPIRSGDVRWETTLSWSANRSKVLELADDVEGLEMTNGDFWGVQQFARVGEPLGQLMGTAYQRDPDGNIIVSSSLGVPLWTNDRRVIGNFNPDWRAGIGNQISYRNARLNVLFDIKHGGEIYSVTHMFGRYAGVLSETEAGRCTPAGDPALPGYPTCDANTGIVFEGVNRVINGSDTTYVPNQKVVDAQTLWEYAYSVNEAHMVDAGFVKLREVTLAYDLPGRFTDRLGVTGLQLALVGRNLALWTENDHIDPESAFDNSNVQGFEYAQMPSARSFGFNITVRP